jgi:Family of unknown function (DUF5330)
VRPAFDEGKDMGFLLKTAFWFSLVLLVLPFNFGEKSNDQPSVGAIQTFFAAREALGDIGGLCERKPEVCEIGKSAMHTVGIRAREAARIAYELLDSQLGQPDTAATTASIPAAQPAN